MFQHFCPYRAQAPRHIIPRVSLRLPWAEEVIGLSARLGLTGLCATIVFSARLAWLLTHVFGFCWFIILLSLNHYPAFAGSLSCILRIIFLLFSSHYLAFADRFSRPSHRQFGTNVHAACCVRYLFDTWFG